MQTNYKKFFITVDFHNIKQKNIETADPDGQFVAVGYKDPQTKRVRLVAVTLLIIVTY